MTSASIVLFLLAGVLFIRSLAGLSKQESAREGNVFGIIGMGLAIGVAAWNWTARNGVAESGGLAMLLGAVVLGGAVGAVLARRVEMTGMPELVAILHSFVGLAAVLVGISSFLAPSSPAGSAFGGLGGDAARHQVELLVHRAEIWVGVAVGALTFTGSIIAWGKLRGSLSGRPLLLPARHVMNGMLVLAVVGMAVPFGRSTGPADGLTWLLPMTALAGVLGAHLVLAIGGADMPVVVSLLNSYSGWAAAAMGFVLSNDLLIVTGALVGSSGAILSIIMCRAMNRSILNVVFGGFGTADAKAPEPGSQPAGAVQEMSAAQVGQRLLEAKKVIIVPGYGMAVARGQGAVAELTRSLRDKGIQVQFAIHPVAGRLPGHMNVLLAEAGVPYDIVREMEHVNSEFVYTDVVLVIGANDIVNPGALNDPSSPIFGMPVLEVWKAKTVVVFKRGMASGYAGVENPLFYLENTQMLFGDARKSVEALVSAVRG